MKRIHNLTVLGIATAFILVPPTIQSLPVCANLIAQNSAVYDALSQGLEKYKIGDYQGTVADSDRVINLNSKNYGSYNKRGAVLYEIKKYQKAIADFFQAINFKPNSEIA